MSTLNASGPVATSAPHRTATGIAARPWLVCLFAWALTEAALLATRAGYPFTQLGLLDSWFYTSFQWDMPRQMREFGGTYYASRVSLYLPGTLLHALLPPAIAVVAYKLLFSACTTFAWVFICQRAAGVRAAVFASVLGPLTPWFVWVRHNDYMDLGVVVYGSLTAAAIVGTSGSSRPWLWRIAIGAGFGSMLIANLSAAASVGLGLVAFYFFQVSESWSRRLRSGLEIALGVGLAMGGFSLASWLAGGPRWVLGTQIAALFQIGGMAKNPWAPENWNWLPAATWLLVPFAALLWGTLLLRHAAIRTSPEFRTFRALLGGHAVACAGALVLEFRGMGVLFHWYYAAFHFALGVPLLILCGASVPRASSFRSTVIWVVGSGALLLFGAVSLIQAQSWLGIKLNPGTVTVALGFGVVLVVSCLKRHVRFAPESALVLILLCSVPAGFHSFRKHNQLRERYLIVHDAFRVVTKNFGPDAYRFWVDGPRVPDGVSLSAAHLWGYRLLTLQNFPEIEQGRADERAIIVPTLPGEAESSYALVTARYPAFEFSPPRTFLVRRPSGVGLDLLTFTARLRPIDPETPGPGAPSFVRLLDLREHEGVSYSGRLGKMIYRPGATPAVTEGPGYPRFRRTDERDHIATEFVTLPPGTARGVAVVVEIAEAGKGYYVVQTNGYHGLGQFNFDRPGRDLRQFLVADDVTSVRVYFQADTDEEIALPRRVAIFAFPTK